ncbi:MAG: TRAP transporter small permease [Desulfohalobiaceae bacterium]|nr:TRAP transporter small permease [Desulfohalobiaceae bacterium]
MNFGIINFFQRLPTVLVFISGLTLLLMTILITLDVVLRYFFNSPLLFASELSEFMMATLIFFALAYTFQHRDHVRVELLVRTLRPSIRRKMRIFTLILALVFLIVFNWQAYQLILESRLFTQKSAVMNYPVWIPQITMLIGGIPLLLVVFSSLIRLITKTEDEDNV